MCCIYQGGRDLLSPSGFLMPRYDESINQSIEIDKYTKTSKEKKKKKRGMALINPLCVDYVLRAHERLPLRFRGGPCVLFIACVIP